MTDQTTGTPPTGAPEDATPAPMQALRTAVEAVTAGRYHGQPSLSDVDVLLTAARAVLPCQRCGSTSGPVRRTASGESAVPQSVCVDTQACATRRERRDRANQDPGRTLVALLAAVVYDARGKVQPGTYDSTFGGQSVRVEVDLEYEYWLTYPDGTTRYRCVGTSRHLAEAVAQSPANWDPPGPSGSIAERLVVHIHGPWTGHPDDFDQPAVPADAPSGGGAR
jgi:hypothetical protein